MEEEEYGYFDDDAEERVEPEASPEKQKKKKKKVDKEGSKKNKKGKGIKRPLVKIVIGGIVLFVAGGLLIKPGSQTVEPAQSAPQDEFYLTVNFTELENKNIDELFVYSEGGLHDLVYKISGTDDVYSVCDGYVIENGAVEDAARTLTPLEGTELFESILQHCNVIADDKVELLEYAGTEYYISVDGLDVKSDLTDSDCANIVTSYTDENGVSYDNLGEYLDTKVSSADLGKSK